MSKLYLIKTKSGGIYLVGSPTGKNGIYYYITENGSYKEDEIYKKIEITEDYFEKETANV